MGEQRQILDRAEQKAGLSRQVLAPGASAGTATRKIEIAAQTYRHGQPGLKIPNDVLSAVRDDTSEKAPSLKYPVHHEESWEIFGLFVNAILADVAVTRAGPPAGVSAKISPKLVRALLFLAQRGGCAMTVGELAEGLGVSLGWASRVADELATAGLLNRVRDGRDRRIVQLRLTERATALSDRLWSDREGSIVAALGEAAPNERQVIARFLRRLTTELERHASELAPAGN
jgi:DNA-binding MarR family transcriptional regulator